MKHILFDADGVLQHATQHWQPALQSVLGLSDEAQAKAVLDDIFQAETEVLETEGGFAERLERVLAKWNRPGLLSQTLDVIHAIEVFDDVMSTVQALRRRGVRCHVASNQQCARAEVGLARRKHVNLSRLQEHARTHGGECLTEAYITSRTYYRFRCAEGHEWEARAGNVLQGGWCATCRAAERVGKR
ncbi:HAD family hydrolase [Piscinibacter sp. HJYY11]|uniref:HAD family hydrolase n=1 Tax=Piscinibacter sp. HJYY11 TaxID=2801333 RepID=UPI00191FDE31|nr:HAD family hydrolase [Piscinibacter sp. HJYY11]MBL0726081.1 HAD family hydrolase [Piscinibacter sp. HJYY11]